MLTCQDIMTINPACCQAGQTVEEVAALMKRNDIGIVPVVAGEPARLIGVITDRDIATKVVAEGKDPRNTPVSDVMTSELVSCHDADPVSVAVDLMATRQVRRVPVVDDRGILVGIIAQADIATRIGDAQRTGEVVRAISEPKTASVTFSLR